MTIKTILVSLLLICMSTGCVSLASSSAEARSQTTQAPVQAQALTVYLVRHAEKVADGTRDPDLTQAGYKRADALASILHGVVFDGIHSTDYLRTRETIRPIVERDNSPALSLYEGNDLERLAQTILATGGTHLIAGHSNTTGEVAELLSGFAGPIITDKDYDRLYIVTRENGLAPTLNIVHFNAGPPTIASE